MRGSPAYISGMVLRSFGRGRPFNAPAAPCQPIVAKQPPAGPGVSMIGRRSLLILFAFISLTACSYPSAYSTSQDAKFSKRGIKQGQLDADWSACRRENTVA